MAPTVLSTGSCGWDRSQSVSQPYSSMPVLVSIATKTRISISKPVLRMTAISLELFNATVKMQAVNCSLKGGRDGYEVPEGRCHGHRSN